MTRKRRKPRGYETSKAAVELGASLVWISVFGLMKPSEADRLGRKLIAMAAYLRSKNK